jgi:hypothetical protein
MVAQPVRAGLAVGVIGVEGEQILAGRSMTDAQA